MGTIAILGGAGQFGRAIVPTLRSHGMHVVSLDVTEHQEADESRILAALDEASIADAMNEIGPIDGLVFAPCLDGHKGLVSLEWDAWRETFARNLTAPMLAMKHATWSGQGSIVLVVPKDRPEVDLAAEAVSGGLLGLMRASSGEFAEFNVRVNAVCVTGPGLGFGKTGLGETVAFLLSSDASFVTGAEYSICMPLHLK